MKTFENYTIVKETEWAILIKVFVSELEKEVEFWLPKSKTEKKDEGLEIDTETWETKIGRIRKILQINTYCYSQKNKY